MKSWRPLAREPSRISPHGKFSDLVPEHAVKDVLGLSIPRWRPTDLSELIHALKLWGNDSRVLKWRGFNSGRELLGGFLNDTSCMKILNNPRISHLFSKSEYGVRVNTQSDASGQLGGEAHVDQILKMLGELSVSPRESLMTGTGEVGSVQELLTDSVMRFSRTQELEFTACAYAIYLDHNEWQNRFGERYSLNEMAISLCDKQFGLGACKGCHVPYAIAMLLRRNRVVGDLDQGAVDILRRRLQMCSLLLERNELSSGGWNESWHGAELQGDGDTSRRISKHNFITVTGHHLEWIAICDEDCLPDKNCIRRAVVSLIGELSNLSDEEKAENKLYLPCVHAIRAFCLLLGRSASDIAMGDVR